jgi:hypothetical protein
LYEQRVALIGRWLLEGMDLRVGRKGEGKRVHSPFFPADAIQVRQTSKLSGIIQWVQCQFLREGEDKRREDRGGWSEERDMEGVGGVVNTSSPPKGVHVSPAFVIPR